VNINSLLIGVDGFAVERSERCWFEDKHGIDAG
jgi:hypothetical protein